MRPIVDAHLDLAWSATSYNRDLTRGVGVIRAGEVGLGDCASRGKCVLSLPELRTAGVAVCVATLLARSGPEQRRVRPVKRVEIDYAGAELAHCAVHAQVEWYRRMERAGWMRAIRTAGELKSHVRAFRGKRRGTPLGFILSMECADPIVSVEELPYWHGLGLRAIGPAHYGRGRYASGTGCKGGFTKEGRSLLRAMSRLGMILDVTHLADRAVDEALEKYDGAMLASHHNCRALADSQRQLPDRQIEKLVKRGGVIGAVMHAGMLVGGDGGGARLGDVVDHIDHVCQVSGDCRHVALGTDLDGGFGYEKSPREVRRYRDVRKLEGVLERRGYTGREIDGIFFGNWLRFFGEALPG